MNITIEVTKDQESIIEKFTTLNKFSKELSDYANGLVNFYVAEGQKVMDAEDASLDVKRLEALKGDYKILASVDALVAAKLNNEKS